MENEDFMSKFNELIQLFKKLHKKAEKEGLHINDDPMFKNFEMLLLNYDNIKKSMPDDMLESMGEPLKLMISQMIEQLKSELNIEDESLFKKDDGSIVLDDDMEEYGKDKEMTENGRKEKLERQLKKIDTMLKSDNLSEVEINELLDKRAKLLDSLKQE